MTAHFSNATEGSVPELETVTLIAQRMFQVKIIKTVTLYLQNNPVFNFFVVKLIKKNSTGTHS